MTDTITAQIIPFPARHPVGDVSTERLSAAMASLSAALVEQHLAILRWRQAMDDLSGCMRTLSTGMGRLEMSGPHAS
jgi:hypothetical protein